MFRSFALFLAALMITGPLVASPLVAGRAHAFSPEGATAAVTDFGGRHGFAIGLSGLDTTLAGNLTDDRLTTTKLATMGLSWSHGGFSVGVSAGKMHYSQYVMPNFAIGSAHLTSISVSHAVVDAAGGTLAVGLSAHRYYFDQASIGLVAASLRWSFKF
jgi:hypothetical protein